MEALTRVRERFEAWIDEVTGRGLCLIDPLGNPDFSSLDRLERLVDELRLIDDRIRGIEAPK